jgi:small subunit ribosomal protein S4e
MATMGNSRHIKNLNAPRYLAVPRKEHKYVVKADAGRHSLGKSLALILALKKTGLSERNADLNKIIKGGEVKVNGVQVREVRYPVGINDVIEIPSVKATYTLFINARGRVEIIDKLTDTSNVYKVIGKYKTQGGKIMIRFHDGRIMEGSKDIAVSDSVKFQTGKSEKHIPMKVGAKCVVLEGEHVGTSGTIKEIKKGTKSIKPSLIIESKGPQGDESFETLISNVMVV